MGFNKEKIELAYKVLNEASIDMWIIAGHESATISEPILPIICDQEFIGSTALILNADETCSAVCTPIDANGYLQSHIFDEVIAFETSFVESVAAYIKKKQPHKIALNYSETDASADGLSYGTYLLLLEAFELAGFKGEVVSAIKVQQALRGIKSSCELSKITHAANKTLEIFEQVPSLIKVGMTCRQLTQAIQQIVDSQGYDYAWAKASNPGVFTGKKSIPGHMGKGQEIIEAGDLVNIDFGVRIDGYSADLQRMFYVLMPSQTSAPSDVIEAFDVIKNAISKGVEQLKVGMTGFELDQIIRGHVIACGYGDYASATGHEVGCFAHDGGKLIAPRKPRYNNPALIDTPLCIGNVLAFEPHTETSCGHLGIEEMVVLTAEGVQFVVPPQQALIYVEAKYD